MSYTPAPIADEVDRLSFRSKSYYHQAKCLEHRDAVGCGSDTISVSLPYWTRSSFENEMVLGMTVEFVKNEITNRVALGAEGGDGGTSAIVADCTDLCTPPNILIVAKSSIKSP